MTATFSVQYASRFSSYIIHGTGKDCENCGHVADMRLIRRNHERVTQERMAQFEGNVWKDNDRAHITLIEKRLPQRNSTQMDSLQWKVKDWCLRCIAHTRRTSIIWKSHTVSDEGVMAPVLSRYQGFSASCGVVSSNPFMIWTLYGILYRACCHQGCCIDQKWTENAF